jgi:hypothetical protein
LDTDYKLLTREERQQRDADQASLKRQTSLTGKPKNRSADMDLPFANDRYKRYRSTCLINSFIIFLDEKTMMMN